MKSLRLRLQFWSPIGSLLQSDTIFGQFAWEYRYLYGEHKLKEVMAEFERLPFVVFSDAFPKDLLCMPLLKPKKLSEIREFFKEKYPDLDYYSQVKRLKKSKYVKVDRKWMDINALNIFSLYPYLPESVRIAHGIFIRNSINRLNNRVEEGLYSTTETFWGSEVDIYVKYREDLISKNVIVDVFESIGLFGFGRDKSTGKGRFKVIDVVDEPDVLKSKDAGTFVSLSSGIPDDSCDVLYGKVFTKFGKHGGYLVFGNPFKNPAVLYKSGSVFKTKEKKEIYGKALGLSKYEGHYQNTYMIPLFVDVEE